VSAKHPREKNHDAVSAADGQGEVCATEYQKRLNFHAGDPLDELGLRVSLLEHPRHEPVGSAMRSR
jgi:hypothetical protein